MSIMRKIRSLWRNVDDSPVKLLVSFLIYTTLIVFLLTGREVIGGDSPVTAYLPVSLLRHGTLRLDPFIDRNPFFDLANNPHYIVESDGHYYSKFSPLTSLLVTPLYAFDFLLFGPPGECAECNATRYIRLSRLAAAMIESGVVVLVFLILRYRVSQSFALVLALGYAFATYSWASATNTLTVQSTGEFFIALSLLALVRIESSDEKHRGLGITVACISLVTGAVVRVQLIPVVGLLGGYLFWRTIKNQWLRFRHLVPAIVVATLFFTYNLWAFGAPLSTGYGEEALAGWNTPFFFGLLGILFSPAHGLAMYSPLLLLGVFAGLGLWLWGCCTSWSNRKLSFIRQDSLGFILSTAALLYLIMMSHWWAWHGGAAYNQRMLQEVHPLLIFLVASAIRYFQDSRKLIWAVLIAAIAWGMGVNVIRLTFYDQHLQWLEVYHQEIVWSLKDAEVLQYIRWHSLTSVMANSAITLMRCLLVTGPAFLLLLRLLSNPRFRRIRKEMR